MAALFPRSLWSQQGYTIVFLLVARKFITGLVISAWSMAAAF